MSTFAELAKVNPEDLPAVKLLPIGFYIWQTIGAAEIKASANQSSTLINFKCKLVRPDDNFTDQAALDEYGNPAGQVRTLMFVVPEVQKADEEKEAFNNRVAGAMQRLAKFLTKDLGMDPAPVMTQISMSSGHMFLGEIKHELDNRDNETWRERFGATAAIE